MATKYQQLIARCRSLASEIHPHNSASAAKVANELHKLVDDAVYEDRAVTDRVVAATQSILEQQWTLATRAELASSFDAYVAACKVINDSNQEEAQQPGWKNTGETP